MLKAPILQLLALVAMLGLGMTLGAKWAAKPGLAPSPQATVVSAQHPAAERQPLGGTSRDRLVSALGTIASAKRSTHLKDLARELAAKNPASAWVLSRQIPGAADREEFCLAVLAVWGEVDAGAAVQAATVLAPGRLHTACVAAAYGQLARQQPAEAMRRAQAGLKGAARESAVDAITRAWAEADPSSAIRWGMDHLSSTGSAKAAQAAVETWADINPAAASQWVAGLPPGNVRALLARSLITTWAEQTPAEAAHWLAAQGVDDDLDSPAAALAGIWAARDPQAAAQWAAALPRSLTARFAAARAVGEWAAVEPSAAAAWLAKQAAESPQFTSALHQSLAVSWAANDPEAAATWLQTLPESPLRQETFGHAFNTWAGQNPDSLASWLGENAQSPLADQARGHLALSRADALPEQALELAMQITVPIHSMEMGRQILDGWRARDLLAANQWLASNPQAARQLNTQP